MSVDAVGVVFFYEMCFVKMGSPTKLKKQKLLPFYYSQNTAFVWLLFKQPD